MRLQQFTVGSLVTSSLAVNLYVSSYAGTITTLQLTQDASGYSLETLAVNTGSSPQPSWLEKHNDIIYAVNEDWARSNGTIASYSTSPSGVLTQIDIHATIGGPVSEVIYNDGKALAVAHYGGSAVQTWSILASGGLELIQSFPFTMSGPGPIPDRQDKPHPHQVVVDPTDSFIVVPDLGADFIRVFRINHDTSALEECASFSTPPGSGPRHGAFLETASETYFFLHSELSNTVVSYRVAYGTKTLNFEEAFSSGTFGDESIPAGAAAAETLVSPDGKYLHTSSRNFTAFTLPPFTPSGLVIQSDTIQSWEIDPSTGELTFKQLSPSGGKFPRQFSLNKAGTLAAVGLQSDGRVVIIERNVEGTFGEFVASIEGLGEVNTVIWDE